MGNCTSCKYSHYDEALGMYVCRVFRHVIYILLVESECPRYKELKGET